MSLINSILLFWPNVQARYPRVHLYESENQKVPEKKITEHSTSKEPSNMWRCIKQLITNISIFSIKHITVLFWCLGTLYTTANSVQIAQQWNLKKGWLKHMVITWAKLWKWTDQTEISNSALAFWIDSGKTLSTICGNNCCLELKEWFFPKKFQGSITVYQWFRSRENICTRRIRIKEQFERLGSIRLCCYRLLNHVPTKSDVTKKELPSLEKSQFLHTPIKNWDNGVPPFEMATLQDRPNQDFSLLAIAVCKLLELFQLNWEKVPEISLFIYCFLEKKTKLPAERQKLNH